MWLFNTIHKIRIKRGRLIKRLAILAFIGGVGFVLLVGTLNIICLILSGMGV